ncbi:hypothetical protein H7J07_14185 [Mycobacterium koreense]|uniref:DUF8174 domain-containing protein n=1 Tax=Mycolicibacillus koreensis TaxID=1069220 RepID=A0A7I7S9U5_9MYCO|nr:hypothetical protein [Mycolicibacillus koreensis]MCV7249358.1 hypothetical protein [Mycolicibacillus koreensis]OSC25972.1 hypothetical protein B8W67_18740 [Mycolicibacillus koreensis]BBY53270.1 hypothetical protein MKOR_05210 [Mycolicibacillus koreensis]
MTGPHPLPPGAGGFGSGAAPPRHAAHPSGPHPVVHDYFDPPTGPLAVPPPGYPPAPGHRVRAGSRWPLVLAVTLAVLLIAGLAGALIYVTSRDDAAPLSERSAEVAIQRYLDALADQDIDVIARNTMCGTYDAVGDRRSDEALAKLSSDAFRKQFDDAEVTGIDKIVLLSQYQAQVLFSMRVTPAAGGSARDGVQGTAQLLLQDGQPGQDSGVLVCSYVLRTGGSY